MQERLQLDAKDADRFWSKVRKTKSCWFWTGAPSSGGYGQFRFKGRREAAHRLSFFIHCDSLSGGACACHSCDVPACVNPDHLFKGTQASNVADMMKKGRHHQVKIAPAVESAALAALDGGKETMRQISQRLNLSPDKLRQLAVQRRK